MTSAIASWSAAVLCRFPSTLARRKLFLKINDFFNTETRAERVADEKDTLSIGNAEFLTDDLAWEDIPVGINFLAESPGFAVTAQPVAAYFQGAQRFLQRFLEGSADRHC